MSKSPPRASSGNDSSTSVAAPRRGFAPAEFEARLTRAQGKMSAAGLEALLLITEPEVFQAMQKVLEAGGARGNDVGRLGHGLGMQLTEPPSNAAFDRTVLTPGMVLTLEPGLRYAGDRVMMHVENIVIRDGGPQLLTRRAAPELPVLS